MEFLMRLPLLRVAFGLSLAGLIAGCGDDPEAVPKIQLSRQAPDPAAGSIEGVTITEGVAVVEGVTTGRPEMQLGLQAFDLDAGEATSPVNPAEIDVSLLAYELFDGGARNLGHYLGTPLVVNFFASWCPPCITEMPDFQTVYEELADRVAFLGLSIDNDPDDALELIAATGVSYDIGWDTGAAVFEELGGLAMPTTVFISASGSVAEVHAGMLDRASLIELIESITG